MPSIQTAEYSGMGRVPGTQLATKWPVGLHKEGCHISFDLFYGKAGHSLVREDRSSPVRVSPSCWAHVWPSSWSPWLLGSCAHFDSTEVANDRG